MKENLLSLTPLILGQMPAVSSTELGSWLLCGACVLVILNQGADFWRKNLKEQPTPAKTYVMRTVCKLLHVGVDEKFDEHSARIEKASADTEALRKEIKSDVKGIHDRIDVILEAVSQLKGKVQ